MDLSSDNAKVLAKVNAQCACQQYADQDAKENDQCATANNVRI